jgi:hypothetical protein
LRILQRAKKHFFKKSIKFLEEIGLFATFNRNKQVFLWVFAKKTCLI